MSNPDSPVLYKHVLPSRTPYNYVPATGADVLRKARDIMLGWPNHAPYTQSGRGQIAVQELNFLADRLESRTSEEK